MINVIGDDVILNIGFTKKRLSDDFELENMLNDIKNIMFANPNATLTQMRTFIESVCSASLLYENYDGVEIRALEFKINEVIKRKIFSDEILQLLHDIRRTGNLSAHNYYSSKELIIVYMDICDKMLEEFQQKYEMDNIDYKKRAVKKYKNARRLTDKSDQKVSLTLLSGEFVEVPEENLTLNNFTHYDEITQRMLYQLNRVKKICEELELPSHNIDIVIDQIENNTFNIVVLGEVNRGKSTLINALLGENILPSNILPTTSRITRVTYGEEKVAFLEQLDGENKLIEIKDLKRYVAGVQENNNTIPSMQVYHPSAFLKNGCVLVDTPGVNDINEYNNEITYEYIPKADVILFILDPDQVLTKSEQDFIRNKVMNDQKKKIFFILNKSDNINTNTLSYLNEHIKNVLTKLDLDTKFYVLSSQKALLEKIHSAKTEYSVEFNTFEADLQSFIMSDKGKLVLFNNAQRICNITKEIASQIKVTFNLSKLNIQEIEKVEDELQKNIKTIKTQEVSLFKEIDEEYDNLKNILTEIVHEEMGKSFDNLVERLYSVDAFDNETKNKFEEYTNSQINNWIKNRINPILANRLRSIDEKLHDLINKILVLDSLNIRMINDINLINVIIGNEYDVPTVYQASLKNTEERDLYMGVGGILAAVLSGSVIAGVVGALIIGYFLPKNEAIPSLNQISNKKEQIISDIRRQKLLIISDIENKILKIIDDHYNGNKSYTRKNIDIIINQKLALIQKAKIDSVVLAEQKDIAKDAYNRYLKEIIIFFEQNNQLIN